jgi:hypothetical protein
VFCTSASGKTPREDEHAVASMKKTIETAEAIFILVEVP